MLQELVPQLGAREVLAMALAVGTLHGYAVAWEYAGMRFGGDASTIPIHANGAGSQDFVLHSACCNRHWELVIHADGSPMLHCEACHRRIGDDLYDQLRKLSVLQLTGEMRCTECEGEGT